MKRVSKIRLFVLLFLLVAGGCTRTEVEEGGITPHTLAEVDASFNLNVLATRTPVTRSITFTSDGTIDSDTRAVGARDSVQTKAVAPLAEVLENQIASLWIGQYDAVTGKRLLNEFFPSVDSTSSVSVKLKQSQDGSKSRVYFVSNAGNLGAIADETTLKKHTLAYASTAEGLPDNNLCKMMGKWEGVVQAEGIKDITVELTRLIAKITFTYSVGSDFTFKPTSVVLKNAPTLSQIEAPETQLTTDGIGYTTYTGTASGSGATVYWYLPENMAGTVSGADAVDAEKKKIGTGVTNATCIELTGEAVQGGVSYKDVTFRFYPGSDKNNYDIVRNSHYTMNVTLIGIDVSDERITVGEIPPIEVDPTRMPAKKGGEKEIQITARPGQQWVFDMPPWLSALLDGSEIKPGATITHQGPANVVFKAVEANPKAEERSVSFNIDVNGEDQEITIIQSGSTLIKGKDISLAAVTDSEGESTFTATEGLQWLAALNGDGWLDWAVSNSATSGSEAPDGEQTLKVKATAVNPSSQVRNGKIIVKAGASVGDPAYTNLKQEITVEQSGATVTGSTLSDIAAKGGSGESSFTATAGLDWAASVTTDDWISLTGGTSGTPTTGTAQKITFDAAVNPNASTREGAITVKVGNAVSGTDAGLTKEIKVTQKASELTASGDPITLAATADASGTLTLKGTPGLLYSATSPDWLVLTGTTSGTTDGNEQAFGYKTSELNLNSTENTGNISVKAGNITKDVTIKQSGSTFIVSKDVIDLPSTESSDFITVNGTEGLPWTVVREDGSSAAISSDIENSIATGNDQTLTFNAEANIEEARSATFIIAVTGGNHSKTVTVKQKKAIKNAVTITQDLVDAFVAARPIKDDKPDVNYYLFAHDQGNMSSAEYVDYKGNSQNYTLEETYTIEVNKDYINGAYNGDARKHCLDKEGGWRLPTLIELYAISTKYRENPAAFDFEIASREYWSCSVYGDVYYARSVINIPSGALDYGNVGKTDGRSTRCVREVK